MMPLPPHRVAILAALSGVRDGVFVGDLAATLRRDPDAVLQDVEDLAVAGHVETAVVFGGAVVCRQVTT
jgi:hypothetical protein